MDHTKRGIGFGERLWRTGVLVGLLAVAAGLFSVSNEPATAQGSAAQSPTRVATLDLVKLINGLEQFKAGQQAADAYTQQLRSSLERAQESMQSAGEDLEVATEATRERLVEEFISADAEFRAEAAKFEVLRNVRHNVILRDTWQSVREGIAAYAEENGYDVIISDDSLVQAGGTVNADPEVYKQFMMTRRVLYTDEAIDITDELMTRMNIDYRASLGAGGGGR